MKLFNRGSSTQTDAGPEEGMMVSTRDGEQMGRIKTVHGGYFQVDVPGEQDDYWLSSIYCDSSDGKNLKLNLGRRELDEHRLRAPGLSEEEDPHSASSQDKIISDEEALQQRERMERELMAQRERMEAERAREDQ